MKLAESIQSAQPGEGVVVLDWYRNPLRAPLNIYPVERTTRASVFVDGQRFRRDSGQQVTYFIPNRIVTLPDWIKLARVRELEERQSRCESVIRETSRAPVSLGAAHDVLGNVEAALWLEPWERMDFDAIVSAAKQAAGVQL